MALTAQNIANDAAREARKYFYNDSTDTVLTTAETLFIGWINTIHQDVMHTSIWKTQLITSEDFVSEPDGSPYVLTANNIRHILSVHDLKNRRTLIPYTDLLFPAATALQPERSGPPTTKWDRGGQTSSLCPEYYIFEACVIEDDGSVTQGMHLLPDPVDNGYSGTVRYFYTKTVPEIDDLDAVLLLPEDGRDIMVAGVVMKAFEYLGKTSAADRYRSMYEGMKKGF